MSCASVNPTAIANGLDIEQGGVVYARYFYTDSPANSYFETTGDTVHLTHWVDKEGSSEPSGFRVPACLPRNKSLWMNEACLGAHENRMK